MSYKQWGDDNGDNGWDDNGDDSRGWGHWGDDDNGDD
jgi:hypothetical protein